MGALCLRCFKRNCFRAELYRVDSIGIPGLRKLKVAEFRA